MTTRQRLGAQLGWTPRADSPPEDAGRDALTEVVMRTFRLNGVFLTTGDGFARPAGLTSARWQVIGAVLREPLTVSGIARDMGLSRQSVQRLANELVADGMAEFVPNPAHRRAPLLQPTRTGMDAIADIGTRQGPWARAVAERVGTDRLRQCVEVLNDVLVAASQVDPDRPSGQPSGQPAVS